MTRKPFLLACLILLSAGAAFAKVMHIKARSPRGAIRRGYRVSYWSLEVVDGNKVDLVTEFEKEPCADESCFRVVRHRLPHTIRINEDRVIYQGKDGLTLLLGSIAKDEPGVRLHSGVDLRCGRTGTYLLVDLEVADPILD